MFEKVFISIVPLNEGYCIEKTRITSENSELNVSKRLEREVHIDEQVAVVAAQVFAEQSNCQFIGSGSILAIQVPVGERPFVVKATSAGGLVIEPVASIGSLIEAFSETSVSGKGDSSGPAIAGEPIENDKQQNLQDYVSYLSEEVVPTLHVPFDLVIDHHLSWDTEGSWRAYFKNLYSKLPQREANLLHASIKILTKPQGNRDGEDKLQNMIVNSDKDILKNLKEALLFVIKTASSCDNEYRDLR